MCVNDNAPTSKPLEQLLLSLRMQAEGAYGNERCSDLAEPTPRLCVTVKHFHCGLRDSNRANLIKTFWNYVLCKTVEKLFTCRIDLSVDRPLIQYHPHNCHSLVSEHVRQSVLKPQPQIIEQCL